MCGFYGQIEPIKEQHLPTIQRHLQHRGPDERGQLSWGEVNFYHARLSILDVAQGKQPMEDGRYGLVFNGEIYNHIELRQKYHLTCASRSDTETLLRLFALKGLSVLNDLDGMFSLAVYDRLEKRLYLIRDRMGEKPLYYYSKGNEIAFASELNVLAAIFALSIRDLAVHEYLQKGWIDGPGTIYENVFQVTPGHYVTIDLRFGTPKIESDQWYEFPESLATRNISLDDSTNEVQELLMQSVRRRIETSDFPVACFLSGGIDSGLVATMASKVTSNLHTYTFKFEGSYDESPVAEKVAATIGSKHNVINLSYNHLIKDLDSILLPFGEPFCDDSAIPSYYIAKEAALHMKVVLNGDGGDELFAGYRRYVPLRWPSWLRSNVVLSNLKYIFPVPKDKMNVYNYLYRLSRLSGLSFEENYLASTNDLFWEKKWGLDSGACRLTKESANSINLKQMLQMDQTYLLPQVLLKKVDISTMQSSLESRTVFFTPELMQLAASLPEELLIKGTTTKVLLRNLAKRLLPTGVFKLPKRGFETPLIALVNGTLKDVIQDHLLSNSAGIYSYFPKNTIEAIFKRTVRFSEDRRSKMIYSLFALEYWLQHRKTYLNNPS